MGVEAGKGPWKTVAREVSQEAPRWAWVLVLKELEAENDALVTELSWQEEHGKVKD